MGKKSRRKDKKEPPPTYTKEEKREQITLLKSKIEQMTLDALYPEVFEKLYSNMDKFINHDEEFYYEERLESAKRTMHVCFKNKKRYPIAIYLPHDDNKT